MSAITVLELHEGIAQTDRPEAERVEVLSVLDSKPVIPAGHGVMRRAGNLSGDLLNDGRRMNREDCVVAATALQEGEPVVTRDTDHFDRILGLKSFRIRRVSGTRLQIGR